MLTINLIKKNVHSYYNKNTYCHDNNDNPSEHNNKSKVYIESEFAGPISERIYVKLGTEWKSV